MEVLYKKPGEAPVVLQIHSSLSELQELVGGYIEIVKLGEDIAIICNEEGKLKGLEANFYVEAIDDIIVGPAVFCRIEGEELASIGSNDSKWICHRLGWRC